MANIQFSPPLSGADSNSRDTAVPQNVLDCVRSALSPFLDRAKWNKVHDAILSSEDSNPKPAPVQDRFMSTEELGNFLHVSRPTIFRYMKTGKIKAHKLGRRNLFSLNEVLAILKNEEVQND